MEKILSSLGHRLSDLDAEYADARFVELRRLKLNTRNGVLEEVKETHSQGIGFRVLKNSAFGFSATGNCSESSLNHHLKQAHEMARQFSKIRHADVKLIPAKPVKKSWQTPIKINPWALSSEKRLKPLIEAEKKLCASPGISSSGTLDFTVKRIVFISSEGSRIEQTLYRTGGWISGELWDGPQKIRRSWPGPTGMFRAEGFEAIEHFNFERETKRIAAELKELKKADETPIGTFDLILKGSILALQIHESFGHAAESDRVFGYEDNFGGRTFLNPGLIGGAEVASSLVNFVSDGSEGPGTGSVRFDDEGIKPARINIVKKGIFQNYMTSRETAYFLNQKSSSANMVAEDWSHYPLIRMTNLSLLPGKGNLEEMIKSTKDGLMLDNELSWSIDEMRLDFQIGGEMGYRIKNGKIAGLVKFPTYHGNTIDFWRSCDRVAGPKEWSFWGFSDCGKGGPYQEAFTGHGLSPAKFSNIRFGRV